MNYINNLINSYPDQSVILKELANLLDKKFYHQLTDSIENFVSDPTANSSINLVEFHTSFIAPISDKINQLRLCRIVNIIADTINSSDKKLEFIQQAIALKSVASNKEATIFLNSAAANLVTTETVDSASSLLDAAETLLDSLTGANAVVYSAYYQARSALYKVTQNNTEFFKNGLLFLSYVNLEDLNEKVKVSFAFDMGITALKETDIYNFGELLEKNILSCLVNTEHQWVNEVIDAFNKGDIKGWFELEKKYSTQLNTHLSGSEALLAQKASILALIEYIFNLETTEERVLSFDAVADVSCTPLEQVEPLLMKALGIGLIKGRIDQIAKTIQVTWVQPRVLSAKQISKMSQRLGTWKETVSAALSLVENQISPEILS